MVITEDILNDIRAYSGKQKVVPDEWIYIGEPKKERYVLGKPGNNTILILGLNPSWALPGNNDRTIDKIEKILSKDDNEYSGWIMMNLYPVVTPHPDELPYEVDMAVVKRNRKVLLSVLNQFDIKSVWLAWGNAVDMPKRRDWLRKERDTFLKLIPKDIDIVRYGDLTASNNPRHPLYASMKWSFSNVNIGRGETMSEYNSAKEKTMGQLTEECNKENRKPRNWTIYEEIEDDAEGGYYYYEDEEVELTREIVHSGGEMPPCVEYHEGNFDDGTSYVSELWYADQVTLVTYYFSTENLKNDEKEIENYLIKVGKLKAGEEHHFKIMTIELDAGVCYRPVGEEIYSVTVAVGDDEDTFCEALL